MKLDPTGSRLVYSTTLGGSFADFGNGIAIDRQGRVYVTGQTDSGDFPQPGFPHLPAVPRPSTDVFVVKLSSGASALVYSQAFGGESVDFGQGIAVNAAGQAHIAGFTDSALFPVVNAAQGTFGGERDAFALKLDASGSSFIYSTYLGGLGSDIGFGVALDAAGNAFVTGETLSDDFPLLNALQPIRLGARDVFVTQLSRRGAFVYSTYLGGTDNDQALGIAVGAAGSVYVTGATTSLDYPLVRPLQAGCARSSPGANSTADAFITQLSRSGSMILFSTCLGGSSGDGGRGIALHRAGTIFIAGSTASPDFPTVQPFQPLFGGGFSDGFVARIALGRPPG